MAHEVENMFSVKETPWHGLGKILQESPSVADAIKFAGLDWQVKMMKLQTVDGHLQVPARAVVRETDDSVLGVVGPDYTPVQNKDAFAFFNPFLDAGEASLHTAGSLRGGKRVWVLAKLNRKPITVTKGDEVEKFLMLSSGHDGLSAVRVGFTPIRVVCANTLAMAVSNKGSNLLRISHTPGVMASLDRVQEIVNTANARFEATAEQYKALARYRVNKKDVENYVHQVFFSGKSNSDRMKLRIEKMTETITNLFEHGHGNDRPGARGTMWALYNGVTQYLSYYSGRSQDTRLSSLWFGLQRNQNEHAMKVAVEMSVGG